MADRKSIRTQQIVSALLFVAVLVMVGWFSTHYKLEADWTAGNRNTITEPSRRQLEAMPDALTFKVFLYPRSELRQSLEADIRRYQRFKDNIEVAFIDPSTHPQQVQDYNISRAGEVVLEYQGRRETLAATTEQAITTALQRLAYAEERWVVFLEGHGEPGLNDTEQGGLSEYATQLRNKGLKVRGLNLATTPSIPDNTSVLVLGSPARKLLEGEVKLLLAYLAEGGNLLWLSDPETPREPAALAEALGVTLKPGTGILLESASLGLPPFVYITTQYPTNPVTREFGDNALFPLVRGFDFRADAGWTVLPMLTTSENAWLETGLLEGDLEMQPAQGDTPGPLTLGITLTRPTPMTEGAEAEMAQKDQRVALIGDSDFLSNGYIGQLGNGLLGLNLVQWLSARDDQISIDIPKAPDRSLLLPAWGFYTIYALFAFLIPAGLIGFGVVRWMLRRRA